MYSSIHSNLGSSQWLSAETTTTLNECSGLSVASPYTVLCDLHATHMLWLGGGLCQFPCWCSWRTNLSPPLQAVRVCAASRGKAERSQNEYSCRERHAPCCHWVFSDHLHFVEQRTSILFQLYPCDSRRGL